jgi:Family of unknown function (DUF5630)
MLPLEELLFLSPKDRKLCTLFEELKTRIPALDRIRTMSQINLGLVFKLSEYSEIFRRLCESPELKACWSEHLTKMGYRSQSQLPQISIFSALMGYFVLNCYYQSGKVYGYNSTLAMKLLDKACTYGIFHALRQRCRIIRKQMSERCDTKQQTDADQLIINEEEINFSTALAWEFADLYKTPGYVEAAQLFVVTGAYLSKFPTISLNGRSFYFYIAALQCLYMAEYLENSPESITAIDNAYSPKTLAEEFSSTPFRSWDGTRIAIMQKYDLKPYDVLRAKFLADDLKAKSAKLSIQQNKIVTTIKENCNSSPSPQFSP